MKCDVVIAGAGPVGLTMASELTRYGLAVRIVDKNAQRTDKSKALVVWSRTLELMSRMGCAESFVAAGMKAQAANVWASDDKIARVTFDDTDTPFNFALMIPQSETERLMEEFLERAGSEGRAHGGTDAVRAVGPGCGFNAAARGWDRGDG